MRGEPDSLRILIAEDDMISATLIKALLEAEGHEVCAVEDSGQDAIDAAAALRPDAVLMDIFLTGDMNGVEAAASIVRDLDIPTIFITGTTDRDLMEGVAESGALGFIKKPISADELRVNIRILLHHHQLSERLRQSENRYRVLFDNAPIGIYSCDQNGVLIDCNTVFSAMLGYASPEVLLATAGNMQALYVDEGQWEHFVHAVNTEGPAVEIVAAVKTASGGVRYLAERGTRFAFGGTENRYQSAVIDVSHRRLEQAFDGADVLQAALDAMPDPVVIMDTSRELVTANRAFYRLAGSETDSEKGSQIDPETGSETQQAGHNRSSNLESKGGKNTSVDTSRFPFLGNDNLCEGRCPFSRFLEDHQPHSGYVALVPQGPEYFNSVTPLADASGRVVGAVQVFRPIPGGRRAN